MLIKFIENWGYIALFLGSMIEGESIVLTISSMAYFNKFNIFMVISIAFLGTLIADQMSFYSGKWFGKKIIAKSSENLQNKAKKVLNLVEKHQIPFIIGFRFIYGIRIISPFLIGMSNISILRFSILNIIAAMIWSILSCSLGYCIGAFSYVLGKNDNTLIIFFNITITLIIIFLSHYISKFFSK